MNHTTILIITLILVCVICILLAIYFLTKGVNKRSKKVVYEFDVSYPQLLTDEEFQEEISKFNNYIDEFAKKLEENGYNVKMFDLTKKHKGEVFDPSNVEMENNNKIFKGIEVTLFNKILLDNSKHLLNIYVPFCDPFIVNASSLLIKGLTEYLISCSYDFVTFEDCRLILYDNEFKEYLEENENNVAYVTKDTYTLIIDCVERLLMALFNIFKTLDTYNQNTKKEINS